MVLKIPGKKWTETEKKTDVSLACLLRRTELAEQMRGSSVSKQWYNSVQTARSVTMCFSNLTVLRNHSDSNGPGWTACERRGCRRAAVTRCVWLHAAATGYRQQSPPGVSQGCRLAHGGSCLTSAVDYFGWRISLVLYEPRAEALARFPPSNQEDWK